MFLPHFDVFCNLLLNRRTATSNLFVLYENDDVWCFAFPTPISVSTTILRLRKVEFIIRINLINVLFIGFVKFEIKQWFTMAYNDQSCVWFSLARLRTFRNFFKQFFTKETALSFFFLLYYASRTCSVSAWTLLFCTYLLPNHVKYYLNSQNVPPF